MLISDFGMRNEREEDDETLFWLELIGDANLVPVENLQPLMQECDQLHPMPQLPVDTPSYFRYIRRHECKAVLCAVAEGA